MNAPFFKFGVFGDEASLMIAFLIGIGFGFFLERAGFGSARKLAAQFYLTDLSVLKVMFTAIITAMTGVFVLSRMGWMDLSMVYLTPTFLVPQIVGGLLLGAGFVIGGYCPGTSCVSAVTGRIDGMVYLVGMIAGLFGFAEVYPFVEKAVHTTAMGQVTLAKLFNIPYGVLVFAVVLMAVGAFAAAEWAERKFGGKTPDPAGALLGAPLFRANPVRMLALALVVAGIGSLFAGSPYRGSRVTLDTRELASRSAGAVKATELADWIIQGRNDFRLVDVRRAQQFAEYHIPGAQNVELTTLAPDFAARNERVVVYSEDGTQAAKAWFMLAAQGFKSVYLLEGGMKAWQDTVLFPAKTSDEGVAQKQIQVARFFGGTPQVSETPVAERPKIAAPLPPPPAAGDAGAKPKKKKEGC